MVNLTDNTGEPIRSDDTYWYKITLADGTELGMGDPYPTGSVSAADGRTLVKVVPAGQGLVFRYQRTDGNNDGSYGWPIGDKGYLRGMQVSTNGAERVLNLSLSWDPSALCLYNNNANYGIVAQQLANNRAALYGYDSSGRLCGMRVAPGGQMIVAHKSDTALALDCEFVKVSTALFKGNFVAN